MLLGGLWHGAAWTFVVWGLLHGAALAVHHLWAERRGRDEMARGPGSRTGRLGQVVAIAATCWFVGLCWIFFRAPSLPHALTMTRAYLLVGSGELEPYGLLVVAGLLGLAVIHAVAMRLQPVLRAESLGPTAFGLLAGALIAVNVLFMARETAPFIYFQF